MSKYTADDYIAEARAMIAIRAYTIAAQDLGHAIDLLEQMDNKKPPHTGGNKTRAPQYDKHAPKSAGAYARLKPLDTTNWRCAECGCDDSTPCPGGCTWVRPNLCSVCADKIYERTTKCKPATL